MCDAPRLKLSGKNKLIWCTCSEPEHRVDLYSSADGQQEPHFVLPAGAVRFLEKNSWDPETNRVRTVLLMDGCFLPTEGGIRPPDPSSKEKVGSVWECESSRDKILGITITHPLPFPLEGEE